MSVIRKSYPSIRKCSSYRSHWDFLNCLQFKSNSRFRLDLLFFFCGPGVDVKVLLSATIKFSSDHYFAEIT